jgi:hypothetical protein
LRILLTTTSFQDTPGPHHELLADGFEIFRFPGWLAQFVREVGETFDFRLGEKESAVLIGQLGRFGFKFAGQDALLVAGSENIGETSFHVFRLGTADILDRVGGGDSFASGLAFGFLEHNDPQLAVDYGAAHGALASTTPGDTSMATRKEVEKLMKGGGARVVR